MRVVELWRYPVKSLQGEQLPHADVGARGLRGDRSWALLDRSTGLTLTARRVPELLFATGRLVDGRAVVSLPDGTETSDDDILSTWLQRDVTLTPAAAERAGTYEIAADAEREDESEWRRWTGPLGSFHDSTRTQVSLVSAEILGAWPARRFRPNVVVDAHGPLVERRLQTVTGLRLHVVKDIDRCVMVSRAQPGGIERDLDVMRRVIREHNNLVGVGALVEQAGPLSVGDQFEISG